MSNLANQTCQPLRGPNARLSMEAVTSQLQNLPNWRLSDDGKSIARKFAFAKYMDGIAFVNQVATLAEANDHHPDMALGYRKVNLVFTTHDSGGLTMNDLVMAAKADRAFSGT